MEEISSGILGEMSRELHSAHLKALRVCIRNLKCQTCPLYDEYIESAYGTKCLEFLMYVCSLKLSQIVNNIEEKGE